MVRRQSVGSMGVVRGQRSWAIGALSACGVYRAEGLRMRRAHIQPHRRRSIHAKLDRSMRRGEASVLHGRGTMGNGSPRENAVRFWVLPRLTRRASLFRGSLHLGKGRIPAFP